MSQQDRHIIDIVANTKANLPLAGTLDEYQSGFSLDGFMGFRWVNDVTEENGGVHVFPSEGTNTQFNKLGLFTGVTGIEQLSPLTSSSKFLGIDITGGYKNISYINEIGFNGSGDLMIGTCVNTSCIYSSTDLLLEAKDTSVTVKTSATGTFTINNGTTNTLQINQSTGGVFNANTNTDLASYQDDQFVTADAIKAVVIAGNPSFGVNGTLNVSDGSQLWEARAINIQEDGTSVDITTSKTWMNLYALTSIGLHGSAQSLSIAAAITAPNQDDVAIESNNRSLITYEYAEANYGGAADDKVLINSADTTSGFLGDLTPGDLTGKIQGGSGIGVTVDVTNPTDYRLIISNTAPAGDLQAVTDSGNLTTKPIIINSGQSSSAALILNDGGWITNETADGTGDIYITNDINPGLSNGGSLLSLIGGDVVIRGNGAGADGSYFLMNKDVIVRSGEDVNGNYSSINLTDTFNSLRYHDILNGFSNGIEATTGATRLFAPAGNLTMDTVKSTFSTRVAGLDPIDDNDYVTKLWGETNLGGGGGDGTVYIDAADTTLDYVSNKLVAGTGISLTIDNTTTPGDHKLIVTATGDTAADVDEVVQYVLAGGFNTQQIMEVHSSFSNVSGYLLPDPAEYTVTILGGQVYASVGHHDLVGTQPNFRGLLNIAQYDSLSTNQYTFSNLGAIPTGGEGGAVQTTGTSIYSADVMTQLAPVWTTTTIKYYVEASWEPSVPLPPINTANGNVLFLEFDPVYWQFDDAVISLNLKIEKVI